MDFDKLLFDLNKVIVHPLLEETIKEISLSGATLADFTPNILLQPEELHFLAGELVIPDGPIQKVQMDASIGCNYLNTKKTIAAYDESIGKIASLEGIGYSTSHSLVLTSASNYIPVNYLTFYFYSRSKELVDKSKYIKYSVEPEIDSKKDYIRDRINFLEKTVPENSILFIDGPLIGGDVYTFMIGSIDSFHKKNIVPIFFVKNSSSNLVTDNTIELKDKFNSDLHWSYQILKSGERTNFFIYRDKVNPVNAKSFCYLKAFSLSPQRVEMHLSTYLKYSNQIENIMDLVYYLLIVQGDLYNPQVRPIAIAEKFARETLKLVDIFSLMKMAGVTPTMNQIRFGGV